MNPNQKVAVVTGSSSGIGKEVSLVFARNGFTTYATMRNLQNKSIFKSIIESEKLDIRFVQLDVTDDKSVEEAIQTISNQNGRLDILVNNAAYALTGAFEDLSMDEIKSQYETNVFGLIRTTQAVLPLMRKQRSGTIINISSGAGRFGYPTGSAYVSTKFAVEGLSEAISFELEAFGIRVILIEPGIVKTNFLNSMILAKKSKNPVSEYAPLVKYVKSVIGEMAKNGSDPAYVANVIMDSISTDDPKLRYLAGKDVEQLVKTKESMSDVDFHNSLKQL
ncbi:MAG TPA: SDR family oxidoreductase [Candidatus Nitrosocosmicus sp.]|nr:SDR family oxidoreductase [Candidatus Nitrosocosmicus sp.]